MADEPQRTGSARPLTGYRDTGEDLRYSRTAVTRTWLIIGVLMALYVGWTLVVYFLEPGLR
jgi:hypothetical protein